MKDAFRYKPMSFIQKANIQLDYSMKKNMSVLDDKENGIFRNLLDQLPQLIWIKLKKNVYYYNQALCQYIGRNINLYQTDFWQEFLHPEDFEHFIVLWKHAVQKQQNFEKQCRIKHVEKGFRYCLVSVKYHLNTSDSFEWMITATDIHDYSFKPSDFAQQMNLHNNLIKQNLPYVESSLSPTLHRQDLIDNSHSKLTDVDKSKSIERKFQQMIELDELTGLYNRRGFNQILKKTIQNASYLNQSVGFLLIDLDYFKHINDTLGHIAGDYLLQVLGKRLTHCFKHENVVVSRLGGDEFAIIVPNLHDETTLLQLAKIARLQMDMPICYSGQYINGGMSIGCAIYPRDAQNSSNLLRCADIALNDLKSSGRGGIRMFNNTMFKAIEVTTMQLSLARSIIHDDKIVPFYQPKLDLHQQKVVGFEALLRWYDGENQLQFPAQIFSCFQDYELATRISAIMQLKVLQDMSDWQKTGLALLPISINAAPVEFLRDNYAETLLKRLAQFNIPYEMIEIEITEQSLSERGSDYVVRALNVLKKAGIRISLDDFGTGHSSLTRLRNYPVDCLKIDRKFIENIETDPAASAIIKAISQIGDSIDLDILIEGIENQQQLEAVKICGCQTGQGFYFYPALDYTQTTQLLHRLD